MKSCFIQTTSTKLRKVEERGLTSDIRNFKTQQLFEKRNKITCWQSLMLYCQKLDLTMQESPSDVKLLKSSGMPPSIDFSIVIQTNLCIEATEEIK